MCHKQCLRLYTLQFTLNFLLWTYCMDNSKRHQLLHQVVSSTFPSAPVFSVPNPEAENVQCRVNRAQMEGAKIRRMTRNAQRRGHAPNGGGREARAEGQLGRGGGAATKASEGHPMGGRAGSREQEPQDVDRHEVSCRQVVQSKGLGKGSPPISVCSLLPAPWGALIPLLQLPLQRPRHLFPIPVPFCPLWVLLVHPS